MEGWMSVRYAYQCENCFLEFDQDLPMVHRDLPTTHPCPRCNHFSVIRMIGCAGFNVPEGACGNAANGYSSYHGDSENFKARAEGRQEPYKK